MNCVGIGSRQHDLHGEERTMDFTSLGVNCRNSDMTLSHTAVSLEARLLLASRSDRNFEILEMKKVLKSFGNSDDGTLFGKIHCLPLPYISETKLNRHFDVDAAIILDS